MIRDKLFAVVAITHKRVAILSALDFVSHFVRTLPWPKTRSNWSPRNWAILLNCLLVDCDLASSRQIAVSNPLVILSIELVGLEEMKQWTNIDCWANALQILIAHGANFSDGIRRSAFGRRGIQFCGPGWLANGFGLEWIRYVKVHLLSAAIPEIRIPCPIWTRGELINAHKRVGIFSWTHSNIAHSTLFWLG